MATAWSDICSTDQIQFGSSASKCIHISAGTDFNFGAARYTAAAYPDLNIGRLDGDIPSFSTSLKIIGTSGLVHYPDHHFRRNAHRFDGVSGYDQPRALCGSGTAGICLGTSSARFKHEIAPLDAGLDQIMKLQAVRYKLNEDHGDPNKLLYGFTAEQGGTVLPALAGVDNEGKPNTFDYLGVVPVLVKAVQEQQKEIERLKAMLHQSRS